MRREIEEKIGLLGGVEPLNETSVPVPEEELGAIETDLGAPLPGDYRTFVQRYGFSTFGGMALFQPLEGPRAYVSHFYGAKIAGHASLQTVIERYAGRMPDSVIPIADDGGGNQICLGIKGNELGKLYYWDHNNEWDEEDYLQDYGEPMPPEMKFQNLTLIAGSFEDFIRCLKVVHIDLDGNVTE
jgi:hypothetical protein